MGIDRRLAFVDYFVEATMFESMCLWEKLVKHPRQDLPVTWEENLSAICPVISEVQILPLTFPIVVYCQFAVIGLRGAGAVYCFYEATSRVVDHELVRAWLDEVAPEAEKTNAMNFRLPSGNLTTPNVAKYQAVKNG